MASYTNAVPFSLLHPRLDAERAAWSAVVRRIGLIIGEIAIGSSIEFIL
jgi:hypothetical protein